MLKIITMAVREIKTYPDPVLRNKTARVETIDDTIQRLIEDMVETMHAAPGVGLAANQVGVPLQVAVIDLSTREEQENRHPLLVLINPEIIERSGTLEIEEGCLSVPGVFDTPTARSEKIRVRALGRDDRRLAPRESESVATAGLGVSVMGPSW